MAPCVFARISGGMGRAGRAASLANEGGRTGRYCASAVTIVAKFRWDIKSPNPSEESPYTVPPRSAGRSKLYLERTLANHKYGAMSNVKPDGPGACNPELIGCCARAPEVPPVTTMMARTTIRASVSLARLWRDQGRRAEARDLLGPIYNWFTEGFGAPDLKDAKALLEALA
jgi:hypothetical protein